MSPADLIGYAGLYLLVGIVTLFVALLADHTCIKRHGMFAWSIIVFWPYLWWFIVRGK